MLYQILELFNRKNMYKQVITLLLFLALISSSDLGTEQVTFSEILIIVLAKLTHHDTWSWPGFFYVQFDTQCVRWAMGIAGPMAASKGGYTDKPEMPGVG
jgi:hypothetical protein